MKFETWSITKIKCKHCIPKFYREYFFRCCEIWIIKNYLDLLTLIFGQVAAEYTSHRGSRPKVFSKKSALLLTVNCFCKTLYLGCLTGFLRLVTLEEKKHRQCFPLNFANISERPFLWTPPRGASDHMNFSKTFHDCLSESKETS